NDSGDRAYPRSDSDSAGAPPALHQAIARLGWQAGGSGGLCGLRKSKSGPQHGRYCVQIVSSALPKAKRHRPADRLILEFSIGVAHKALPSLVLRSACLARKSATSASTV